MPLYEHIYIARQDVSAQQVETLTETFQNIITEAGGKVEKTEYWGIRPLQYKIKKNRKGHYSLFQMEASAEAISEMERQMRLNEDILRHMTLRIEEFDPEQSAILTRKDRGERGDRDRGDRDRGDRGGRRSSNFGEH